MFEEDKNITIDISVEELLTIKDAEWKEIELFMDYMRNKEMTISGLHYSLGVFEDEYINESEKIRLMKEAYYYNSTIYKVLLDDIIKRLDIVETDNLFNNYTEDDYDYWMNKFYIKSAKTAINYLAKLNKISEGITNCVDVYPNKYDTFKNDSKRNKHIESMPYSFSDYDKGKLLNKFDYKCAFTGSDGDIEYDHVIPISWRILGTTPNNMLPLSKSINVSKGNRNIFRWYDDNKERFNLSDEKFTAAMQYIASMNDMTLEEYKEYVHECEKKVIERVLEFTYIIEELEHERKSIDERIAEYKHMIIDIDSL